MYYMYYIICIRSAFAGFCWLFLGFWRPRRFLYVLLLAFLGFSWVFCVRGDFCLCFCWLLLAFLVFFASAAIFVCAFAGFCWLFLVLWRPRRFLYVLLLAFAGFSWVFGVRCRKQAGQILSTPPPPRGPGRQNPRMGGQWGEPIHSHSLLTWVGGLSQQRALTDDD